MRKRFETQLEIGQIPIEQVRIPTKSRDELPPTLAGLQWIFCTPEINEEIFTLLENRLKAGKNETGRPGMDLWHILVLGVVRLTLDCDYDRLEYLVHYDKLIRQVMGLDGSFKGEFGKGFHQKTLSENLCHVDEELIRQINEVVVKEGRKLFKKKEDEKIEAKADSYVLESTVHFPTDLNLLWDASRKSIRLLHRIYTGLGEAGWRKAGDWEKKVKGLMRLCGRIQKGGGSNKEVRIKAAVGLYVGKARELEKKVRESLEELEGKGLGLSELVDFLEVEYFHKMLHKHIDMIDRRLLKGETIPHEEKVFSLFEPHTEWVNKGKAHSRVELGHKLLVATCQYGLLLDYRVLEGSAEVEETLALAERLLNRYGWDQITSLSVDQGFSRQADRELLELYIPEVVMPKKGRRTQEDREREGTKRFKKLRRKHSAVESDINSLEHHGLNRCPDKDLEGFKRYAGFGVLAYNLHKIGNKLLERRRVKERAA